MKNNILKKILLIILICVGVFGIINNLIIYSDRKKDVFVSKISPAIPMSTLPLKITKDFDLYETEHGVYYFGGEIYNNGTNEIIIERLQYTFNRGNTTYMQTKLETDIHILPKSTYTLNDAPTIIVYDNTYIVDYAYVKIIVNGQEQYLYHENYDSIISKHEQIIENEKSEFELNKKRPMIISIICMAFTCIIGILLIKEFINDKK